MLGYWITTAATSEAREGDSIDRLPRDIPKGLKQQSLEKRRTYVDLVLMRSMFWGWRWGSRRTLFLFVARTARATASAAAVASSRREAFVVGRPVRSEIYMEKYKRIRRTDHGLIVEERFKSSLGNLGLVRGVLRDPANYLTRRKKANHPIFWVMFLRMTAGTMVS